MSSIVAFPVLLSLLANAPAVQQPADFPGRLFDVGNCPWRITTGDLNADGRLDLVTANSQGNSVSRRLGLGLGDFGTHASYAVGLYPVAVAIGDLDADGRADVATANQNSPDVTVLHGNGAGGFPTATTHPLAFGTTSIAIADLSGDGRLDVAVTQGPIASVAILLGSASGTLSAPSTISVGAGPSALVVADFDSNGAPDIAATSSVIGAWAAPISVLLASGGGGFAPYAPFDVGGTAIDITAGDLDLDGNLDIVTGTFAIPMAASLLLGNGSGGFAPFVQFGPLGFPNEVAIGDVNADTLPDIAVTGFGISAILGDGSGGTLGNTKLAASAVERFALADLEGDGSADLLMTDCEGDSVTVLLSSGGGPIASPTVLDNGFNPRGVASADFDGNGFADAVVGAFYTNTVDVFFQSAARVFQPPTAFGVTKPPGDVAVGDFDGDGNVDVVASDEGDWTMTSPGSTVTMRFGDGLGGFGASAVHYVGQAPSNVFVGDLNGDGASDVVTDFLFLPPIGPAILVSNGSGGFSPSFPVPFPKHVSGIGDANGDGFPDIVGVDQGAAKVHALLSAPGGGFAGLSSYPAGADPVSVTIADIDGDGTTDLLVGSASLSSPAAMTVSILHGLGAGAFAAPASYYCGGSPVGGIRVGDLDADGVPEILTANAGNSVDPASSISITRNDGLGGFSWSSEYDRALGGGDPIVIDFDVDGRPDVASVGSELAIHWGQLGLPTGIGQFGTGTPGCLGALGMLASGVPKVGTGSFGLAATNAPPESTGWLLVGAAADLAGTALFGLGFIWHVDVFGGPVALLSIQSDSSGSAYSPIPIPGDPTIVGLALHAQSIWRWPVSSACDPSPLLVSSTRGVTVTVQP